MSDLPIDQILIDDEWNCRGKFQMDQELTALALDIQKSGLIQPVVVVPNDDPKLPYKLIAGFRRMAAHKWLKKKTILAIVRPDLKGNQTQQTIINLKENLQRKELNIVQEAKTISRLLVLGASDSYIGNELGVNPFWVQVRKTVLEQPQDIQDEIAKGTVSQEHLRQFKFLNLEERYAFIRQIKDAIIAGKSPRQVLAPKKKTDYVAKRNRKPGEIGEMLEIVYDAIDPSFATRCMAWSIGNISTIELYADMLELIEREPEHADGTDREIELPLVIKNDVLAEVAIRKSKRKRLAE